MDAAEQLRLARDAEPELTKNCFTLERDEALIGGDVDS